MNESLYRLAKKTRRESTGVPFGRLCISLPVEQIEFLGKSEKSVSLQISEMVEERMKLAGAVVAPVAARAVPDLALYKVLKSTHERIEYLGGEGFSDGEMGLVLNLNMKELRKRKDELSQLLQTKWAESGPLLAWRAARRAKVAGPAPVEQEVEL